MVRKDDEIRPGWQRQGRGENHSKKEPLHRFPQLRCLHVIAKFRAASSPSRPCRPSALHRPTGPGHISPEIVPEASVLGRRIRNDAVADARCKLLGNMRNHAGNG